MNAKDDDMVDSGHEGDGSGSRSPAALFLRIISHLPGFAALFPPPVPLETRLATFPRRNLPCEAPVRIRWNPYQVPYIQARSDRDLALVLGLVHAHLREGQLALLKRAAQGRLAEIFGPPAARIDELLRILDFGRAVGGIMERMPADTHVWLGAFVAGLNHYQENAGPPSPEFALLGLRREPWTVAEVLRISRLMGADVNWLVYFTLLREEGRPDWPRIWARARAAGVDSATSFRRSGDERVLSALFSGLGRSGSNSVALSPEKSASGGALIASDPHLALSLPNTWLLLGAQSPSYHVVGLMPVGVPVFALGRNPSIAWGGTNLRALASDLFDVDGIDPASIRSEPFLIRRRFCFPARRIRRYTPFGPILSDARVLPRGEKELALSWVGHQPSDEVTALLAAARARHCGEFRASFADFGVPGQNLLCADSRGNILQVLAAAIPDRAETSYPDLLRDPADPHTHWTGIIRTPQLPYALNPREGYLASANNRPVESDILIGLFFTDSDRITRLREVLSGQEKFSRQDLARLQRDTRSPAAQRLAGELARLIRAAGQGERIAARLGTWDGDYRPDSAAAATFEILLYYLVPALYADGQRQASALLGQWGFLTKYLIPDLEALPPARRARLLGQALRKTARRTRRHAVWGDMHRLEAAHWLGRLPVLGKAFRLDRFPVGGSRETPMKTAHGLVAAPHGAVYGSQARHISDLSDPDENYFVLFGGQDGWLGSANFADQIGLWRQGDYIRMPLREETIAAEFPLLMDLEPAP
jgi:penicillin amidase